MAEMTEVAAACRAEWTHAHLADLRKVLSAAKESVGRLRAEVDRPMTGAEVAGMNEVLGHALTILGLAVSDSEG